MPNKNSIFNITLFKRTAIGLFQYELIYNTGLSASNGTIRCKYGKFDGNKTSYDITGNEKQFAALVAKKKKEGYKSLEDLNPNGFDLKMMEIYDLLPPYSTDEDNYYKPMKCQPFVANKFNYEHGAYAQPKINGNRGTISWGKSKEGLFSKDKPILKSHEGIILNIKHIEDVFVNIFKYCDKTIVFDGEFYAYGEPVTNISGACRNPKNPIHYNLSFHCFDLAIPDIDQDVRLKMKHSIFKKAFGEKGVAIQHIPQDHEPLSRFSKVIDVYDRYINTDEEASEMREICIAAGYEGAVIREAKATYKFGSRPKSMMKLKKPKYASLEVLDIVLFGFENNSDNNIGKGCKFILRNDLNNQTFEIIPTGTVEEKLKYFNEKEKYIGNKVPVRYYERTVTNLPFHANIVFD